jgi:hypothetical protein
MSTAGRSLGGVFGRSPGGVRGGVQWILMPEQFVVHVGLSDFTSWYLATWINPTIPDDVRKPFVSTSEDIPPKNVYRLGSSFFGVFDTQCTDIDLNYRMHAQAGIGTTEYTEPSSCYANTIDTQAIIEAYFEIRGINWPTIPASWIPLAITVYSGIVTYDVTGTSQQIAYSTLSNLQTFLSASLGDDAPDQIHEYDGNLYARFGNLIYPVRILADIDVTVNSWVSGKFTDLAFGTGDINYGGNYTTWTIESDYSEYAINTYHSCARSLNSSVVLYDNRTT